MANNRSCRLRFESQTSACSLNSKPELNASLSWLLTSETRDSGAVEKVSFDLQLSDFRKLTMARPVIYQISFTTEYDLDQD